MAPELESNVPLVSVALYALLNPATIVIAFWLGRQADQAGKLLIAAFAGAVAGVSVLYVAAWLRIWQAPTLGRAAAGVFAASLVTGLAYAGIGYALRRTR